MSTLVSIECNPSVYQSIKANSNMFVVSLRPHLKITGAPSGTVKVQIQDENGRVIVESSALTITSLKTLAYAHKYIDFQIQANLAKDVFYRLAVVCGGGYSYSNTDYVAVCLDWDNPKTEVTYSPSTGLNGALDFEIWERNIA